MKKRLLFLTYKIYFKRLALSTSYTSKSPWHMDDITWGRETWLLRSHEYINHHRRV